MLLVILSFGFLLALRGTRALSLQRPVEGLIRIWREAADLFVTAALVVTLEALLAATQEAAWVARDYAVLISGVAAFLLARYQKKTDAFFLTAFVLAFLGRSLAPGLLAGCSWLGTVVFGIAAFQTGLLGLRYRLLFSGVPAQVKGWPVLCLLAALLALVFGAACGMLS